MVAVIKWYDSYPSSFHIFHLNCFEYATHLWSSIYLSAPIRPQTHSNTHSKLRTLCKLMLLPPDNVFGEAMWNLVLESIDQIIALNTARRSTLDNVLLKYDDLFKQVDQKFKFTETLDAFQKAEATIQRQKDKLAELDAVVKQMKSSGVGMTPEELKSKCDQLRLEVIAAQKEVLRVQSDKYEDDIGALNRTIFELKHSVKSSGGGVGPPPPPAAGGFVPRKYGLSDELGVQMIIDISVNQNPVILSSF